MSAGLEHNSTRQNGSSRENGTGTPKGILNLTTFRVVRRTPVTKDVLDVADATVMAPSKDKAQKYLVEALLDRAKGSDRARLLLPDEQERAEIRTTLLRNYQLVAENGRDFDGTMAEWIRAIDAKAMPAPVVLPAKDELVEELEEIQRDRTRPEAPVSPHAASGNIEMAKASDKEPVWLEALKTVGLLTGVGVYLVGFLAGPTATLLSTFHLNLWVTSPVGLCTCWLTSGAFATWHFTRELMSK